MNRYSRICGEGTEAAASTSLHSGIASVAVRVSMAGALLLCSALVLAFAGLSTERGRPSPQDGPPFGQAARAVALSRAFKSARPSPAGGHTSKLQVVAEQLQPSDDGPPEDELCTMRSTVVEVHPRKFLCAAAGENYTCDTCEGAPTCFSPGTALHNLGVETAKGWVPVGLQDERQSVTLKLQGGDEAVRAILWANVGDTEHDPEW